MATTTTTAACIADSSSSTSFMLPGMTSPELENYSRVVRFNGECVLIPEASPRSKLPVVSTKSYALPLWKRKATQSSEPEVDDPPRHRPGPSSSPDDSRVVLKLPIPTFRARSSRSPSRGRSVSTSPVIPRALPPCLVHRSPSTPPSTLSPVRRPSLPTYHRRKDEQTIPLRECCPDCERITEECLKEGEQWQEKFSRGASRRRSASLDHNDRPVIPPTHHHTASGGFPTSYVKSMQEFPSRFAGSTSTFTLTVDEVDKRRKSQDFSADEGIRALSPLSNATASAPTTFHSPGSPFSSPFPRHPRSSTIHDRDVSSSSTNSSTSTSDEFLLDILDPRRRLRSSPIEEEDEAQLFPLPRRSPNSTPSPSVSPKASPLPSPNASTSFLPGTIVASPFSSKDSLASKASSSSQESLLKASLSRKAVNGHLAAPELASSKLNASSTPSTATSSPLTPPPPKKVYGLRVTMSPVAGSDDPAPLSPKGPRALPVRSSSVRGVSEPERASNQMASSSPSPATESKSSIPLRAPSSPSNVSRQKPLIPSRLSAPSSSSSSSSLPPPLASPTKATAPSSTLSSSQVNLNSRSSTGKRKQSFTTPFVKAGEAIRDVGADVLKGVSSMGAASP